MPAGQVFRNAFVEISSGTSTDISLFLTEARLTMGRDGVEDTAVGDDTHTMVAGLRNDSLTVTVKQGYASGGPEQTLTPLVLNGTEFSIEARPDKDAAVSASNPRFRMEGAIITGGDYTPMGGRVGELVTSSVVVNPVSGQGWTRTIT